MSSSKPIRITCSKLVNGKRVPYYAQGESLEYIFNKIREANTFRTTIFIGKKYQEKYKEYLETPKPSKQ